MQEQPDTDQPPAKSRGERLNFIIAICAILISAASFYATYLQADAANKQVQAMTMPMLQFGHGNIRGDDRVVYFSLINAGMGPALLHSVSFEYQGRAYPSLFAVLQNCCQSAMSQYKSQVEQADTPIPQFITSPLVNTIIPGQDKYGFFELQRHPDNVVAWDAVNQVRFELGFKACYCSLLGDCFEVDEKTTNQAVNSCP